MCVMKTVTVREAQHNLAEILHQVEGGETVQILRRKNPVALLVPTRAAWGRQVPVDWDGHEKRMASVWGGVPIGGVDAVLDDLRDGR
jgi:antitoxin (DNA-binding transcriptional repressor) of toxin-antitoxin stability system